MPRSTRVVHYLHYLEKDVVSSHDVQNTCCALHQLGEYFYRATVKKGPASVTCIERS